MKSKKVLDQPKTDYQVQNDVDELIEEVCEEIKQLLLEKNMKYNNSLHQVGPLFELDPITGIKARINDKINRIKQVGLNDDTEDTLADLIGYLIHLKIAYKLHYSY